MTVDAVHAQAVGPVEHRHNAGLAASHQPLDILQVGSQLIGDRLTFVRIVRRGEVRKL